MMNQSKIAQESYEEFSKRFDYIHRRVVGKVDFTPTQLEKLEAFKRLGFAKDKNIALCGLPSTGKTTLFHVLSMAIFPSPSSTLYGSFEIINQGSFLSEFVEKGFAAIKKYDNVNLCIDDFGTSEPYAYHKGVKYLFMGDLMERRYELSLKKKLFTHLSANIIPNKDDYKKEYSGYDIKDFLGERGYSRFKQTYKVVSMGFVETNIINYRDLEYPLSDFKYKFDWNKYYTEKYNKVSPDEIDAKMQALLDSAKVSYAKFGKFDDFGNGLFNHLFKKNDEVLLEVVSENDDTVTSLAKERCIKAQESIVNSLIREANEQRIQGKVLADMRNDIYPSHTLSIYKKQIFIEMYLFRVS